MLTITRAAWAKFAPRCPDNYTSALFDNLSLLDEAGILESPQRWCHFAAQVYHETGAFREIREDLRYTSTAALRKAWPARFGHKSDDELKPLLRNPVGLADQVYGCYSGRKASVTGNVGPGEAFYWRGGGWFNTTFKPSVDGYCRKLGIDPTPQGALDDPILTLRFAILEWTETGCNELADANDLRGISKAINTGSATSGINPNGMDGRKAAYARACKYWGDGGGQADHPASLDDVKRAAGRVAAKYGPLAAGGGGAAGYAAGGGKTEAPAPRKTVQDGLDAAQKRVDQAKHGKALVEDARSFIPGIPKAYLPYAGAGLLIAATLAFLVFAHRRS